MSSPNPEATKGQPQTEAVPVTQILKPSDGKDTQAECSVIGTVLHFPDSYLHIANLLKPEDFAASLSAVIWRAIGTLVGGGRAITLHVLAAEVFKRDDLTGKLKVIDESDLAELIASEYMSAEVNAKNIIVYANTVLDRAVRKRVAGELVAGAMRLASDKRTLDRRYVQEKLAELMYRTVGESTVRGTRDVKVIAEKYADWALCEEGMPEPMPTGFDSFNRAFNGDYPGTLSVLFGHQGQGKTSLLMSKIYHDMLMGRKVVVFTTEQSDQEVIAKLFFKLTGLRKKLMRGGDGLTPQDKVSIQSAVEIISQWPLRICSDYRRITVDQMRTVIQECAMLEAFEPNIVYHDGIWRTDINAVQRKKHTNASRTFEIGLITDDLIGLGIDFKCAIWSTHQLNRVQGKTEQDKIDKNDLSESSELLNNAHRVFAIHRPEADKVYTQWYCLKDRPTGKFAWEVTLAYDPDFDLFADAGGNHDSPF